jgi:trehalose 6-phosphate synthase
MTPVMQRFGGRWMFASFSAEDREVARSSPGGKERGGVVLQVLDVPEAAHRGHYEVVSVEVLGRLFHYLFELARAPVFDRRFARAWHDYARVNVLYAEAILRAPGEGPVFVEDYHLMLVGREIRRLQPSFERPLLYFHHVPWCAPDYFALLPHPVRSEILSGILAYDGVAFHSRRWARAFRDCCDRFLPGVTVGEDAVEWEGRHVPVIAAPAAVDTAALAGAARSPQAERWAARLSRRAAGRKALVRVDRADLWKNALRGFEAFELLLEQRPDLAADVCFLAVLTPTRTWVPEYRRYQRDCERAAERINARFGGRGRRAPVSLLLARDPRLPDHHRALGALRIADVVLVNPLFDGLNLVAKEAVVVSEHDSVVVLSENAGAYEDLAEGALGVNPFDVAQTAEALGRAVDMPARERRSRATALRRVVRARTPEGWILDQLRALDGR